MGAGSSDHIPQTARLWLSQDHAGRVAARISSKLDAKTNKFGWLQAPGNNLKCIGWAPGTSLFHFLASLTQPAGVGPGGRASDLKGHMLCMMRASVVMSFFILWNWATPKINALCGTFYRTTYPAHWDSKRAKPAHRGSPMNRPGIALTAIVVLAFLPVCARAQTASITGTVKDTTGAVVPQTRITAQNVATHSPRTAVTDESGIYRITNLAPGTYDVLIEKTGFKSVEFSQITLAVDHVQNLDATLTVSTVEARVKVTGESVAPLDLNDAQIGNMVTSQQISSLPLVLRDPYQLALLSPGVNQSNSILGGLSVNGSGERNNNFLLDGTDNNDTDIPGLTLPQPGLHCGRRSVAPRFLAPSPIQREQSFRTPKSPLRMSPRVNRPKPRPIRPASTTYQTSPPGITRFPSQPKGSAPTYLK